MLDGVTHGILVLETVRVDADSGGGVPGDHAEVAQVVGVCAGGNVLVVYGDQNILRGRGDVLVEGLRGLLLGHGT